MSTEQGLDSPEAEKSCSLVPVLIVHLLLLWGETELLFALFPVERTVVLLLIVNVISQENQFPSLMYQAGDQHEAFALKNPVVLRHCQALCSPRKASGADLQQQEEDHKD